MDDDLRVEYGLDALLKDGVTGKYAEQYGRGTNVVLLEPDVAAAFHDSESVNAALRLVIQLRQLPRPESGMR